MHPAQTVSGNVLPNTGQAGWIGEQRLAPHSVPQHLPCERRGSNHGHHARIHHEVVTDVEIGVTR
jgi:hypothetical protein